MQEYLNDLKDVQNDILNFLDNEKESESIFLKIKERFSDDNYLGLLGLKPILMMIANISINHHRSHNFYQKIEQILDLFDNKILNILNNFYDELIVGIFRKNKRIILYLLKKKILFFDYPTGTLLSKLYNYKYFTPEIKEQYGRIPKNFYDDLQPNLYQDLPENFEENRYNGENESYICKLIREDLIDDFVIYVNQNNVSVDSKIPNSIYETSELLTKYTNVSLIKYSAFCGSIQIFQYLRLQGASLGLYLLKFAVHSNNAEMINLVEEYAKPTEKWLFVECYKESIKCHHNEIANYIREKYLDDVDAKILSDGIKYSNYVMYPDLTEDYMFFHLCQYDYKIAKLYMKDKEIYNNFQINLGEPDFEEIGEGYFGPTRYYALEDEDEEKYHEEYLVFKIINRDYVRFKDIDNLMKIKYPSLLNPIGYDFCFSAHYRYDNIAVFFKYFENGSLDDYLDKKDDLNQTQKYIILLGTAITLKYLNEKGISLASLHPKNILINDNFYPVISDFTISDKTIKKAIKMKSMKENIGYKKFDPYLAPENIEKYDAPFNESSNAYSFALIAFRLLSNEPLFKETGIRLHIHVIEGRRPYSRNLNNEIAEFLNICWAQNAQDRPTFEKIIMMMTCFLISQSGTPLRDAWWAPPLLKECQEYSVSFNPICFNIIFKWCLN